jgi:DNA-binding PadR family transcriptional regulator
MKPSDLIQGTLDVLILKSLATESRHGWAIAKRIQAVSGDVLQIKQGSSIPRFTGSRIRVLYAPSGA